MLFGPRALLTCPKRRLTCQPGEVQFSMRDIHALIILCKHTNTAYKGILGQRDADGTGFARSSTRRLFVHVPQAMPRARGVHLLNCLSW